MDLAIIIPNYNSGNYIERALTSILNQSYKPSEIIIVDAGSEDQSLQIAKEYASNYKEIRLIINENDKGVAHGRDIGIKHSESKFITTLDSDDYYYNKHKLKNEVSLLRRTPSDSIIYSDIVKVDKNGLRICNIYDTNNVVEGNALFEIITRSKPIPRDFIFKRNQYFNVGRYDFELPIYEDWDLKIRLALKNKFYYTGAVGTAYRQHDEGLSSKDFETHRKWLNRVFQKNLDLLGARERILAKIYFFNFMFRRYWTNKLKEKETVYNLIRDIFYKLRDKENNA